MHDTFTVKHPEDQPEDQTGKVPGEGATNVHSHTSVNKEKKTETYSLRTSAVHRSRRAGAGVLTYFAGAGAGAGVCSPPAKLRQLLFVLQTIIVQYISEKTLVRLRKIDTHI